MERIKIIGLDSREVEVPYREGITLQSIIFSEDRTLLESLVEGIEGQGKPRSLLKQYASVGMKPSDEDSYTQGELITHFESAYEAKSDDGRTIRNWTDEGFLEPGRTYRIVNQEPDLGLEVMRIAKPLLNSENNPIVIIYDPVSPNTSFYLMAALSDSGFAATDLTGRIGDVLRRIAERDSLKGRQLAFVCRQSDLESIQSCDAPVKDHIAYFPYLDEFLEKASGKSDDELRRLGYEQSKKLAGEMVHHYLPGNQ